MTPKERKSLIEKVALHWREGGIEELKTYGNFQKYTPIFHFHISEPFDLKENFIYITELFGNINQKPNDALPMNFAGMRRQLHGNYQGLNQIILTGISEPNFKPYLVTEPEFGTFPRTLPSPSFQISPIKKEDKIIFDNALLYLNHVTAHLSPKIFNLDSHHEFFSSTFHI